MSKPNRQSAAHKALISPLANAILTAGEEAVIHNGPELVTETITRLEAINEDIILRGFHDLQIDESKQTHKQTLPAQSPVPTFTPALDSIAVYPSFAQICRVMTALNDLISAATSSFDPGLAEYRADEVRSTIRELQHSMEVFCLIKLAETESHAMVGISRGAPGGVPNAVVRLAKGLQQVRLN